MYMAGIKGAKQKKFLTEEQIFELKDFKILTEDSLKEFMEKHKISFRAIKRRVVKSKLKILFGYSFQEYTNNKKLQSIYNKNNLYFVCKCNFEAIVLLGSFQKRRYKIPVCNECYKKEYFYDESWRENNKAAQLIAQNRPEVLEKQIASQKKRYENPEVIEHYRNIGRTLWENPDYRERVLKNSSISKCGIYNGLTYQSSIELAFIIWCQANNKKIENYKSVGIPYVWEGKEHRYYPDFIIDDKTIVEIKSKTGIYLRFLERNKIKFAALAEWCKENHYYARLIFDSDLGKRAIKEARKLHGEISKKKIHSV